jgi:nitronate monooxygenase
MAAGVPAFPSAAAALAPLRAAAEARGCGDFSPLWSGQAGVPTADIPAGRLTRELIADARRLLGE